MTTWNETFLRALNGTMDAIRDGADFCARHAPEAIRQWILYEAIMAWIGVFASLAIAIGSGIASALCICGYSGSSVLVCFGIVLFPAATIFSLCVLAHYIPAAVLATWFHKLFVIRRGSEILRVGK